MTRLPSESWNTVGLDGPEFPHYKVGPICSMPLCSRPKQQTHHITRRSFLGGDYAWVKFTDGAIAGNLIGLDTECHQLLTENKARIIWDDEARLYEWTDRNGENLGQLSPQPPIYGVPYNAEDTVTSHRHVLGPGSLETCASCGQKIKLGKSDKPEPARRRKTWVVTVPDDAEDGATALDILLNECRDFFSHDENSNTRYFSLVQALALVIQHGHRMMSDE